MKENLNSQWLNIKKKLFQTESVGLKLNRV